LIPVELVACLEECAFVYAEQEPLDRRAAVLRVADVVFRGVDDRVVLGGELCFLLYLYFGFF